MAKNTPAGTIPADPPDAFAKERADAHARDAEAEARTREAEAEADAEAQRVAASKAQVRFDPESIPSGFVLFHNPTERDVKFTVMDEGNRPRPIFVKTGKTSLVPIEYARIVPDRAPQLVELGRKAASSEG